MKVILFFSRFTLICNISFLLFATANMIESARSKALETQAIPDIPLLKDIIITLGVSAIFINLMMCLFCFVWIMIGKARQLPRKLAWINFIFLLLQFYFFYFLKSI